MVRQSRPDPEFQFMPDYADSLKVGWRPISEAGPVDEP